MPAEGAPAGGQILFMETIWPAPFEPHQTYSTHDPPISLSHFPPAFKLTFCPCFLLLCNFLTSAPFPSHYLFYPTAFSPLFLSQKISYSLMHGSCREQCYFIFPWQRSLCFNGSHFSFGSNVLLCQG